MKEQIKGLLRKVHLEKIGEEQFIGDINKDCTNQEQKKILLCYLDYQRTVRELRQNFGHTNRQEMMQMIKVSIEKGWCVDVCGCNDRNATEQIKADYYDYILGFGLTFKYAKEQNPKAKAVLYMTENPYNVSYDREMERLTYFTKRTGRKFHLERTGVYYHQGDEEKADAILCLGDEKYFPNGKEVIRIFPSAIKNPEFNLNFEDKKKTNFLVYGVDGFVHKGNDILLEIFEKHPYWTLYLCGARGEEKAKEAGYQLPENVHACGFVETGSQQFNEIIKKCFYMLLPSCSEAPSTAVLTGMRHGVIPIVSKGIGLDELGEFCRYFEDFHIENIEKELKRAIAEDESVLREVSEREIQYADTNFSLEHYTETLGDALSRLFH